MHGEVDHRSRGHCVRSVSDPNSLSSTARSDPPPLPAQLSVIPLAPCGFKSVATVATRPPSLVAPQQEPEHEHDSCLDTDAMPLDAATKTATHVIKRRNVGVPKFLRFLFQILEVENPSIIAWSHDGTAFQIIQPEALATQILPRYFKHNKVSSFQRQLNYFGFKKWTKTQTNICTFSHPFFVQSDKDQMKRIKRKERATPVPLSPRATPSSMDMFHPLRHEPARPVDEQVHAPDLTHARTPLLTQQALKRQKSNTVPGAPVTFFNSAAAGRRHSTGMLPNAEAMGQSGATASVPGQDRAGTPAEQEFELEMEARTKAMATAPRTQPHILSLPQRANAKPLAPRPMYPLARGNGGRGHAIQAGRRNSEQLVAESSRSGKTHGTTSLDDFLASSLALFHGTSSTLKCDASTVQPVSSTCFYHDGTVHVQYEQRQQDQQTRQHMNRHVGYRGGMGSSIKGTGSLSTMAGTVYPSPPPHSPLMTQSKFGDFNAIDYSNVASRLSQRLEAQHFQPHNERIPWYQLQHEQARHEATPHHPGRDYIDVLLESAALDENLPLQASTSLSLDAWHDLHSSHMPNGSRSTGAYSQQPEHHSQMSLLELPHTFNSRF